ncbi:hypothetical protein [Methylophilus sp. DW102]|uniref:hypothetical protein n=1 Tax=Methylophilus sp. DW102 TaxID=3095607 RepID=UPI00308F401B|nr:hypothetical protein MTDW_13000 [Methylophilus sp. DW102]
MAQDFDIDLDDVPAPKKAKAAKPVEVDLDDHAPAVASVDIDINKPDIVDPVVTQESTQDQMPNDRDLVNQLLGQIQMANAFAKFADVVSLQKLKYIKDNKIYRSVAGLSMVSGVSGEKIADVGTWAGFCKALGLSVSKVDEDLLNLNTFGEEALKQLSSVGAGVRELRQYRKLPEDQKTALIEAAKSGDKDQLLDLAETLIEKHVTEKAELNEKVAALEADLTQAGKRANNMDAEIERLTLTNERLVNKQRLTSFEPLTEDVRLECMHLQATIEVNFASLNKLFESVFFAEQSSDEQKLRVEQVYIAMQAALAAGVSWLNSIHEIYDEELAPKRIQAQHVLTPPEAERWLLEFESLKNAHNAAEAARQIARDKDKPRGRGRPAGSTNKGE